MRRYWLNFVPFLAWWPEIDRRTLRADALAAVVCAVACLPQGVAFATIAGMPPQYGLYAAMVPAILAALFGSSRQMVSGPATPASIVLFSALSAIAVPGTEQYVRYAITIAFMAGVLQLAMGLARLGAVVNFMSHSVVVGFSSGAGLLIAASQVDSFLGVDLPHGLHFHETVIQAVEVGIAGAASPDSVAVGTVTIVVALVVRRYWRRVPYMIAALVAGSLVAGGIEVSTAAGLLPSPSGGTGIEYFSAIPPTLPPPSLPDFRLATLRELAPVAFAVTLFTLAQAVSISRSLAARTGDLVDGNQEFVGQGLSNLAGSFFSSYVSTGSLNRSAVNADAGARTPLAAILGGFLVMASVLVVGPVFAHLPTAAMAGVLFIVAAGIVDVGQMRTIARASPADSAVMWTTFATTLLVSLDFAILLGVLLSLVLHLRRASRPSVQVRVPDPRERRRRLVTDARLPQCPQLAIVRIDGPMFFGSAEYVNERLRIIAIRNPEQRHLLVLMRNVTHVDTAGAEVLVREQRLRAARGGQVYLHQIQDEARELLRRAGYLDEIGEENLFPSKGEAIAGIFGRLDREVCLRCERRIFNECRTLPRAGEEDAGGADEVPAGATAPAAGS